MSNKVFCRREQKYMITAQQRQALEALLNEKMPPDKFPYSYVRSIYYDTPDRRIIRRSLEKPAYKEKIRLRCYGSVTDGSQVFLELKKKFKGIVYKRRVSLTLQEAEKYMADPEARLDAGQIGREIDYVKQFYPGLEPVVNLSYERLAWRDADKDLRVTVDWNVRASRTCLDMRKPPEGELLVPEDRALVEVKTARAMPLWLVEFINRNEIRKISFSKYGTVHLQTVREALEEKRRNPYVGEIV